jgi:hypothetical protein
VKVLGGGDEQRVGLGEVVQTVCRLDCEARGQLRRAALEPADPQRVTALRPSPNVHEGGMDAEHLGRGSDLEERRCWQGQDSDDVGDVGRC